MNQKLFIIDTASLSAIVAGLVREGLAFEVYRSGSYWVITITGY